MSKKQNDKSGTVTGSPEKRKYVRKTNFIIRLKEDLAECLKQESWEQAVMENALKMPASPGYSLLYVLGPDEFRQLLQEVVGMQRYAYFDGHRFLELDVGGHLVYVGNSRSIILKL